MAKWHHPGLGVQAAILGRRQAPHNLVVQLRRQPTALGPVQPHLVTTPVQHIHVRGFAILVRLESEGDYQGQQVQRFQHHHGHRPTHGTYYYVTIFYRFVIIFMMTSKKVET